MQWKIQKNKIAKKEKKNLSKVQINIKKSLSWGTFKTRFQ